VTWRARAVSRRVTAMRTAGALAACALALADCSQGAVAVAPDGGGQNCQQIRMCVFGSSCADDGCVQTCAAQGSSEARTTFEALRACTARACPTLGDVNCACGEQCQADGACLHEADACVGTVTVDDVCDLFCA
jgi:hypothetical protein